MRGFIGQNEFLLRLDALFFSETITNSLLTDIFGQLENVKIQINILILY